MNNIKSLIEHTHGNAKNKGFYDLTESVLKKMGDALDENKEELFSDDEIKSVKDAYIAQRLMLITSELGEALEGNRKGKLAKTADQPDSEEQFPKWFLDNVKESFEDEVADVAIRIFDMCGWLGVDLQKHIELKHTYNQTREKLHGKKY